MTATRTYPGPLANQDTQYIPKPSRTSGNSVTLQAVDWQTEGTATLPPWLHTGSATSPYVKGAIPSPPTTQGKRGAGST